MHLLFMQSSYTIEHYWWYYCVYVDEAHVSSASATDSFGFNLIIHSPCASFDIDQLNQLQWNRYSKHPRADREVYRRKFDYYLLSYFPIRRKCVNSNQSLDRQLIVFRLTDYLFYRVLWQQTKTLYFPFNPRFAFENWLFSACIRCRFVWLRVIVNVTIKYTKDTFDRENVKLLIFDWVFQCSSFLDV